MTTHQLREVAMREQPSIRILIADDHEVVRIGLSALLDRQEGFRVVGQAGSGQEAVRLARSLRPDVVVLDIRMPNGSGTDACRQITAGAGHAGGDAHQLCR